MAAITDDELTDSVLSALNLTTERDIIPELSTVVLYSSANSENSNTSKLNKGKMPEDETPRESDNSSGDSNNISPKFEKKSQFPPKPSIASNEIIENLMKGKLSYREFQSKYLLTPITDPSCPNNGNIVDNIEQLFDSKSIGKSGLILAAIPKKDQTTKTIKLPTKPSPAVTFTFPSTPQKPLQEATKSSPVFIDLSFCSNNTAPSQQTNTSQIFIDLNFPSSTIPSFVVEPTVLLTENYLDQPAANAAPTSSIKIDLSSISNIKSQFDKIRELSQEPPIIDNEENMSVIDIVSGNSPPGWIEVFKMAFIELADISLILARKEQERRWYPRKVDLFRAFWLCPLLLTRVVIIGQDPYHSTEYDGTPTAVGMSFSTRRGYRFPPSLRNIFKEIQRSEGHNFTMPDHGDLTSWAKQGVLLLNTCLTVEPKKAKSHSKNNFWMGFIQRVTNSINNTTPNCIYVLWGKDAQKIKPILSSQNIVLESSHPSPLSARRGFEGCGHFSQINSILAERGEEPINWNL